MIELFIDKKDCCGCTSCMSICSQHAISMQPDEEGFLYPIIDRDLCIECGICKTVCPLQNEVNIQEHLSKPLVYALKHKSEDVIMSSSSGGAYTAISDYVLNASGNIYGVQFNKDFTVQHVKASTKVERDAFKGSKYVQSNLGDVFLEVKRNLVAGRTVLFTGTPCQTAGLIKFLESVDTTNLILNDIICHGTPSPLIWHEYVEFIKRRYNSNLKAYTFRSKEKGWRGYNVKVVFEDGKIKINSSDIKIYAKMFSSALTLRPSCYYCKFANMHRPSDITIGDFWGIEKCMPEMDDNIGVSLVIVNTVKGEKVFEQIKDSIFFKQINVADCLQFNLQQPTKEPIKRERFWRDFLTKGFIYVAKKYVGYGFLGRIRSLAAKVLRRLVLLSQKRKF
jgi:coenzyme F420-reducing hydrogenase beta subunit